MENSSSILGPGMGIAASANRRKHSAKALPAYAAAAVALRQRLLDDQALSSPGFARRSGRRAPRRSSSLFAKRMSSFQQSSVPPNYYLPSTVMLMRATPLPVIPITPAAAAVRSMMRPAMKGPRSLMRTSTERPFPRCVTRTRVPNASVLWAAVIALGSKCPPEATRCPCR